MRKFLYELGAAAAVVFGIIPICIYAACYAGILASYETFKIFPAHMYQLFEYWYTDKEQ